MSNEESAFPFKTTHSERRIIQDLLAVAALRTDSTRLTGPVAESLPSEQGIDSAEKFIAYLHKKLFPGETALREKRAEMLKPLQSAFLRTHFDATLETAALTLNARIRSAEDYRAFVEQLSRFDFAAWQKHCEGERTDAD